MLQNFLENDALKSLLGGSSCSGSSSAGCESIATNLIPGASASGTTASFGSILASAVNLLFIVIFIVAIYVILKSTINKVRSDGQPKGNEVFAKVIRNTFISIFSLIGFYLIVNVVWFLISGTSLFAAPNALRECGGVTILDYTKENPGAADAFYNCVNGQFVKN